MDRTFDQTISDLRMLLRDEPPFTTADITDFAVVYLDGNEIRGVFLSADEPGALDEPLVVDAWFVVQVDENLREWFTRPHFSLRPSLRDWALDAPPVESAAE
ncbi:hypothetical protein P9281_34695 [Caballeronia sp. LP003]|uniref:hypothetical protein n=1 Tax=Caballeronia sp. LP003 TaxID=3038551 RepID=UPI0028636050|nr:hypothetical protein [Caballeronia sp. LP003]MDR5791698.1 hypothetical protein [Caballeronia sp. LP003]